ncbi:cell wall-active antibiotics response protein LiaF [Peribacillus sp. SCS-155]|uniref:cell wall-active antibiotics response protein LiaF n=1 Tax=Peribacillus sedimenti TaxID=3115297 RepID=UPI0039069B84
MLIGIILLFVEITFFNGDLLFSLAITIGLTYFGRKKYHRTIGVLMFWIGLIGTVVTILNMMVFKFFLVAILGYLVISFVQSKKNPEVIKPVLAQPANHHETIKSVPMVKASPLFENKLFGRQKTPDYVYEWNDINIQAGIGDIVVDLSNTLLPKGESVISIRNAIGNIQILVPYDIEVSVRHSAIAGKANIFEHQDNKVFNHIVSYQTSDYEHSINRLKIITSVLTGDIEVKRI